jgi:hypothetical protein
LKAVKFKSSGKVPLPDRSFVHFFLRKGNSMKKLIALFVIVGISLVGAAGCGDKKTDTKTEKKVEEKTTEKTEEKKD